MCVRFVVARPGPPPPVSPLVAADDQFVFVDVGGPLCADTVQGCDGPMSQLYPRRRGAQQHAPGATADIEGCAIRDRHPLCSAWDVGCLGVDVAAFQSTWVTFHERPASSRIRSPSASSVSTLASTDPISACPASTVNSGAAVTTASRSMK